MKRLILVLVTCAGFAHAEEKWRAIPDARILSQEGFSFTALDVHVRELSERREIESADLELLEDLVLKTNVEALEDYDRKVLARFHAASVQFLLGREAWEAGKKVEARHWLLSVPRWHRYYPESRYLLAQDGDDALASSCVETSEHRVRDVQSPLLKRYYTILGEDCQVLAPRRAYKEGRFQEALTGWDQIPKRAYKWPSLLLEKAWAYYSLKDYNRTLGTLVTYKAPLLSSYFEPEAEVLTALAYFRLCLYADALAVVERFYSDYRPKTEALEAVLKSQKNSSDYFYELMNLSAQDKGNVHPFVQVLATRISHRPRYALDLAAIKKVDQEMARLNAEKTALAPGHAAQVWMGQELKHLAAVRENLVGRINYHVKRDLYAFISGVYALSEEMFKLKLEIIARKKDLVYGSKQLVSDRGRGSFSQVQVGKREEFWKFQGAFWADELGDYSFGLPSNCETTRKEAKNE